MRTLPPELVRQAFDELESETPETLLAWAGGTFGRRIALASSFGVEDVVLIHMATRLRPDFRVLAIDTGRLPEETFAVAEELRRRGARIEWLFPDRERLEELQSSAGLFSFRQSVEQRRACCQVRKVEPLLRALRGLDAWVTGLRREQSLARESVRAVEVDEAHGGLLKLSPLAAWSEAQVWAYVRAHRLPYSALHDRGYPSVGCAPCTRAVEPGEPPRAGRWWWESPEHKECGLHLCPVGKAS
jgi:phosphoadenosine phosphosulfate reductase